MYLMQCFIILSPFNFAFSEHTVVIPEVVLEELDRFKTEASDRGANCREISRLFDQLRGEGNLLTGIPLNDLGGVLRIETNHLEAAIPPHWDRNKGDNRILQICLGLAEDNRQVILISRDKG